MVKALIGVLVTFTEGNFETVLVIKVLTLLAKGAESESIKATKTAIKITKINIISGNLFLIFITKLIFMDSLVPKLHQQ